MVFLDTHVVVWLFAEAGRIAFAAPLCTRDRHLRDHYQAAFWTAP